MDAVLEEFDREWKAGNKERAKAIARDYVTRNRSALNEHIQRAVTDYRSQRLYEAPTLEELVALVDYYRANGDEASRITIDMLLLDGFAPQRITGRLNLGSVGYPKILAEVEAILRGE